MAKRKKIGQQVLAWLMVAFLISPQLSWSAPSGGVVTSGTATITQAATTTTINQATSRAIINWNSFGINLNELVKFLQPSTSAATLNRILGGDPSVIAGALQANGRVFLLNPNGILFSPTATVNVGGLLASTLSMKDSDFLSGNYVFSQDMNHPLSYVVNQGTINAADGGSVVLLAPMVSNEGTITANLGKVGLGAGTQATVLNFDGQGLLNFVLSGNDTPHDVVMDSNAVSALLENIVNFSGVIEAGSITHTEDGHVILGKSEGFAANIGTIRANGSANNSAGNIVINSTQGTVLPGSSLTQANGDGENSNGGTIHALSQGRLVFSGGIEAKSGTSGNGGDVELSGDKGGWVYGVVNTSAPHGTVGNLLIDPVNAEIVNWFDQDGWGDSNEPQPTDFIISANLLTGASSNITISSSNSITLDDMSTLGGTLTLPNNISLTLKTGTGDIIFENTSNTVQAQGNGNLTLNAGTTLNSGGEITALANLTTDAGNITVTADKDIIASGSSIQSISGDIGLSAGRDLTATDHSFIESTNHNGNSGNISLSAGRNLEVTNSAIETSADDFGDPTSGNVSLTAGNNLTLNLSTVDSIAHSSSNNAISGNISFSAGNDISMSNDSFVNTEADASVDPTSGNITLNAAHDLNVDSSTIQSTANTSGGEDTQSGSIILTAGNDANITNGSLVQSISNTQNANSETVSTSGDVDINAGHDINVNNSTVQSSVNDFGGDPMSGNVSLTAGNDLSLDNSTILSTATSDTANTQSGSISLTATNGSVTITGGTNVASLSTVFNGSWSSTSGDISLSAGTDIHVDHSNIQSFSSSGFGNSQSGAISMNAGQNVNINSSAILTQATNTGGILEPTSGDVVISAGQDVNIGSSSVQSLAQSEFDPTTSGNISLTATNGDISIHESSIQTRASSTASPNVISGNITFNAGNDIVIANSYVNSEANNGGDPTSGDITMNAGNNLDVNSSTIQSFSDASGGGNSQSGTVSLTAGSDININNRSEVQSKSNSDSGGSQSGAVSLIGGNDLNLNSSLVQSKSTSNSGNSQSGDVTLVANEGDVNVDSSTVLSQATNTGGILEPTSGNVIITGGQNVNIDSSSVESLAQSQFDPTTSGNISLTATNGDVNVNNSEIVSFAHSDNSSSVQSGNIALNAANGNINITGSYLTTESTFGEGNRGPDNGIDMNAGFDVFVNADSGVTTGVGDINITAGNNAEITHIFSGGNANVTAGGSITSSNPSEAFGFFGETDVSAPNGEITLTAVTGIGTDEQALRTRTRNLTTTTTGLGAETYIYNSENFDNLSDTTNNGDVHILVGEGGEEFVDFSVSDDDELNANLPGADFTFNNTGGNIALGLVNTLDGDGGVTLNASGSILNAGENEINLTADHARLTAGEDIGSADLPVSVLLDNALNANADNGSIWISSPGDLILGLVSAKGLANLSAQSIVGEDPPVNVAGAVVVLTAVDGIGTEEQALVTDTPNLSLTTTGTDAPIFDANNQALKTLTVNTNNSNANVNTTTGESLTFADLTLNANMVGTDVFFDNTGGNIFVGNVNVGMSNSLSLTAAGSILSDPSLITGYYVTLDAGKGIGAPGDPIQGSIAVLNATAHNGGIYFNNADSFILNNLLAQGPAGNIVVSNSAGDLLLNYLTASGSIELTAVHAILDNTHNGAGFNLTAGGNSSLVAGSGIIGSVLFPVRVNIPTGILSVKSGGIFGLVSVDINGITVDNTLGMPEPDLPDPSGQIIFNGNCLSDCPPGNLSPFQLLLLDLGAIGANPDTFFSGIAQGNVDLANVDELFDLTFGVSIDNSFGFGDAFAALNSEELLEQVLELQKKHKK